MKRYWGAYGNKPDDANLGTYDPKAPPAQQFRNPVHCVERSNDGLVYVCDRANDRDAGVPPGRHVREGGVLRQGHARLGLGLGHRVLARTRSSASSSWPTARTTGCASSCARRSRRLTTFGDGGRQPGQFYGVHSIATDRRATSTRPRPRRESACRSSSTRASARCCAAIRACSGRSEVNVNDLIRAGSDR